MNILNYTLEAILIKDRNNHEFKSVGVATVEYEDSETLFEGISITQRVARRVKGLPNPTSNTFYIVSDEVAAAVPDRADLLVVADDGEGYKKLIKNTPMTSKGQSLIAAFANDRGIELEVTGTFGDLVKAKRALDNFFTEMPHGKDIARHAELTKIFGLFDEEIEIK